MVFGQDEKDIGVESNRIASPSKTWGLICMKNRLWCPMIHGISNNISFGMDGWASASAKLFMCPWFMVPSALHF